MCKPKCIVHKEKNYITRIYLLYIYIAKGHNASKSNFKDRNRIEKLFYFFNVKRKC